MALPVLPTGSSPDPENPGVSQVHNLWAGGFAPQVMRNPMAMLVSVAMAMQKAPMIT